MPRNGLSVMGLLTILALSAWCFVFCAFLLLSKPPRRPHSCDEIVENIIQFQMHRRRIDELERYFRWDGAVENDIGAERLKCLDAIMRLREMEDRYGCRSDIWPLSESRCF